MYRGVSSTDVLARLADGGTMGFFGTAGLPIDAVEAGLRGVLAALPPGAPFGANLLYQHTRPEHEMALVDLLLRLGVGTVEAAGFVRLTPALVKYRLKGGRVLAKVSRTDIAEAFLRPAPAHLVSRLVDAGDVTPAEAERAAGQLMADDLCVEADDGWQPGTGCLATLLPSVLRLRDAVAATRAAAPVHVGAAGGIGTPEAAAAAFVLGADFVLTGSVNQCTVEAATSPAVKDMLAQVDVHDVDRAPWSELFELGVQARVMKRGVFTPARANKLYDLWRRHDSFDEIDPATRTQIEERYLQRPFAQAYAEARGRLHRFGPAAAPEIEHTGKEQLALVFRGYLHDGMEYALTGAAQRRVDYLVYCGSAMGAFNRWVAGTELEPWRSRHVDDVAVRLLTATAAFLGERSADFHRLSEPVSVLS
jgi:trans-AT polyketide synthase/acyltransferase/oxidoreductase domain-containing protein